MSLAAAIALASQKGRANTKRKYESISDDDDDIVVQDTIKISQDSYPNISIYACDYHGNIMGIRIRPPLKTPKINTTSGQPEIPGKLSALALHLAKEKGIDPSLVQERRIQQYNVGFQPVASGEMHAGSISTLSCCGKYLISTGAQDECIRVFKRDGITNKLAEYGALHRHDCSVTSSSFATGTNNQLLLTGGANGIIYAWNTYRWDCIAILQGHGDSSVVSIASHPTLPMALSVSRDSRLCMWDLRPHCFNAVLTQKLRPVKPTYGTIPLSPLHILFSPDGNYYSILYNRICKVFHSSGEYAGQILRTFNIDQKQSKSYTCQTFITPYILALGDENGNILLYHIITGVLVGMLEGQHKKRVKSVITFDSQHTQWITQYTENNNKNNIKQDNNDATNIKPNIKKSRLNDKKDILSDDIVNINNNNEIIFIVSADSDGILVLWQLSLEKGDVYDAELEMRSRIIPEKKKKLQKKKVIPSSQDDDDDLDLALPSDMDDDDNDMDNSDNDDDNQLPDDYDIDPNDNDDKEKPIENNTNTPTYTSSIYTIETYNYTTCNIRPINTYNTDTRIISLAPGVPFLTTAQLHSQGIYKVNDYASMAHITEEVSKTRYDDPMDKVYAKQQKDFIVKRLEERDADYKLAAKDKRLRLQAEGKDADGKPLSKEELDKRTKDKKGKNGKAPKYTKEEYLKMDQEFQAKDKASRDSKQKKDAPKRGSAINPLALIKQKLDPKKKSKKQEKKAGHKRPHTRIKTKAKTNKGTKSGYKKKR